MSKMSDFLIIARRRGKATFNDHIANYFEKTGKPPLFLQVRSLKSQVSKELKKGGALRDLVDEEIMIPSEQTTGRVAEWSEGLPTAPDVGAITLAPSPSQNAVHRILDNAKLNGNQFQMPDSEPAVLTAYEDLERLPATKQVSMANGMTALDFERRLAIKDVEAKDREIAALKGQIEDKDRLNKLLSALLPPDGGGSAVARK